MKKFQMDLISFDELLDKEFPPTTWLVKGLVPAGCITMVSGYTTSFKTWLILDMAICIATGEKLLGQFSTTPSKVLIIDEESGEPILQKRFLLMTQKRGLNIKILSYKNFESKESGEVIKYCLDNEIKVVILDSLIRSHSSDENSSSEMARVSKRLAEFKSSGIALIFIHHNRKSGKNGSNPREDSRGSSEILGFVDSAISIELIAKKRQLKITQIKSRLEEEVSPFLIGLPEKGSPMFKFEYISPCENKETKSKPQIAAEHIIALFQGNDNQEQCQKEIIDAIRPAGAGESSIKEAINDLITDNILQARQGQGNSQLYSLK